MKINVVCVGNLKEKYLKDACAEYAKRLSGHVTLTITEIKEEAYDTLAREEKSILPHLKGHVIVMAIGGKEFSSPEIAAHISKLQVAGTGEITFVIGGSTGLSDGIIKKANTLMSFGKITLPHQLFRVVLLEQIYRAFSINAGSSYHK